MEQIPYSTPLPVEITHRDHPMNSQRHHSPTRRRS